MAIFRRTWIVSARVLTHAAERRQRARASSAAAASPAALAAGLLVFAAMTPYAPRAAPTSRTSCGWRSSRARAPRSAATCRAAQRFHLHGGLRRAHPPPQAAR